MLAVGENGVIRNALHSVGFIWWKMCFLDWLRGRGTGGGVELDVTSNQISDTIVWKSLWKMQFIVLLDGSTSLA